MLRSSARTIFAGHPQLSVRLPSSLNLHTNPNASDGGFRRTKKLARGTIYFAAGVGTIWAVDRTFNAEAIARNCRTLWTCLIISLDYKLNFTPEKSDRIPELHERVANRIYDLLVSNGGLYIKIGQAIAANAAVLPPPIAAKFAALFDRAPQVPYSSLHPIFLSDFSAPPSELFADFDEAAVASASVAQVHKARLKDEDGGGWVAVKIQKPQVAKQVEWDLATYRVVMWLFENVWFGLPVYWVVDFVSDRLREELDFEKEAANAEGTAALIAAEPSLRDRVYVPKVYKHLSTKRIMTAEWIDGVSFSDREGVRRLMGEGEGAREGEMVLKGGVKEVMRTLIDLSSAQIFRWGFVHCDPHPGNVFVRPHPDPRFLRSPQLVLIDHGLYVTMGEEFRRAYATLWRALLIGDIGTVGKVVKGWGVGEVGLFASATLMRPVAVGGGKEEVEGEMSEYDRSVKMKERLNAFLQDTDRMPKELVFVGRNVRLVQVNNQRFGSPVNRIKMTGLWASSSLTHPSSSTPFLARLRATWSHVLFRLALFSLDVAFWTSRLRAWVLRTVLRRGRGGGGFEDELEEAVRIVAKRGFGVEVGRAAFEG